MGEQVKGHWRNAMGARYLAAEDFEDGIAPVLTIKQVSKEQAYDTRTKEEAKLVSCSFNETQRLLALNKTKARAIAKIAGSNKMEEWTGHKIRLSRGETMAFGRKVPCVVVQTPT